MSIAAVTAERLAWRHEHYDDPRIARWLADNPPPPEWDTENYDALDYAYLEMPNPDTMIGRGMLALGL